MRRALRVMWLAILAAAAVFLATFAAVWAAERHAATRLTVEAAPAVDAVLILGGGSDPDGHLNHWGRDRVRAGERLLDTGRTRRLILSGGSTAGPLANEAIIMKTYAVDELGVDPDLLVLEPRSRTTLENLRFSFALGREMGIERYAVVTSAFHLHRTLMLARLFGRPDIVGVAADARPAEIGLFAKLGMLTRETLAWWYNLGKAAGWIGLGVLGFSEDARGEWIR